MGSCLRGFPAAESACRGRKLGLTPGWGQPWRRHGDLPVSSPVNPTDREPRGPQSTGAQSRTRLSTQAAASGEQSCWYSCSFETNLKEILDSLNCWCIVLNKNKNQEKMERENKVNILKPCDTSLFLPIQVLPSTRGHSYFSKGSST